MSTTCTEVEVALVEEILQRVAGDLSMITDRELVIGTASVSKATQRPAGRGKVHISFRLGIEQDGRLHHGCILLPLAEAISLACFLMMVPDEGVTGKRKMTTLDETIKDAMLEVGNFIGGAADAALRDAVGVEAKVRSEGCQGVRAGIRPALIYSEGAPLVVGTARATIHEYPEFEMILMLPELEGLGGA